MSDAVTVMLASARAYDHVEVDTEAPDELDVSVGAEVRLRMSYRAYEQSAEEDHWTFRLEAQVEGEEQAVAERTHVDRKLISDDILSHVGVDIVFPVEGTFNLTWTGLGRLSRREWNDPKPPATVDEKTASGALIVRVHP